MSSIVYTALRNLASGHTSGLPYTLDFGAQVLTPLSKTNKSEVKSLDDSRLAVLHGITKFWQVSSDLIAKTELPLWEEFFDSVAARESFTFDAYGDSGTPDNIQNVTLEGEPSLTRKGNLFFVYSFKVKVS